MWCLFTRAEEVGFYGALEAIRHATLPKNACVLSLECSKAFAHAPQGEGVIVRVGDRVVLAPADVTTAVNDAGEGTRVALSFLRAGKPMTSTTTLGRRPSEGERLRMDFVGTFAPALGAAKTLGAGKPLTLAALRGRVVILDYWATWCGPCRLAAPRLSMLSARYGAQGLSVIGMTTDDEETAKIFKDEVDVRYPLALDTALDASKAYGVTSLPTMFVIDKLGIVREVFVGYSPANETRVEALVQTLLAESTDAPKVDARENGKRD